MEILALAVLIFAPYTIAQETNSDLLTNYLNKAVSNGRIAGVHAMISKDGKLVYSEIFGYADIEAGTFLRNDAIYRIASMTKIVTAIAALQLWEQGIYNLDDPVSKHLPVFKKACVLKKGHKNDFNPPYETESLEREPTIRDLFRHTSGIWGGKRYTIAGLRQWNGSLDEFVRRLMSVPLDTQPGTRFQYGYSTDVLGLLVEKWSGQKLDTYFNKSIFVPLGIHDSGFTISDDKLKRLPKHYEQEKGKLICKEQPQNSPFRKRSQALSGGGGWNYSYPGLLTTMDDWMTVMEMIRNLGYFNGKRILKEETVKMMCSDQLGDIPGAFEEGTGYGLGIGVVVDGGRHGKLAGNGTVYWAGAPHNTYFYIDFEKKISAAMFMQSGPFGLDNMMNEFLEQTQAIFGSQDITSIK